MLDFNQHDPISLDKNSIVAKSIDQDGVLPPRFSDKIENNDNIIQISNYQHTANDRNLKLLLKDIRNSLTIFIETNMHEPIEIGFHASIPKQVNIKNLKNSLTEVSVILDSMFNDDRRADQYNVDLRSFTQNIQSVVDQFRLDLNRLSNTDVLSVSKTNKVLEIALHYKQNFSALVQELSSYLAHKKTPPRA